MIKLENEKKKLHSITNDNCLTMEDGSLGGCRQDQICDEITKKCTCPQLDNIILIKGQCREIIIPSVKCNLETKCDFNKNEECLPYQMDSFNSDGTCQCKIGLKRNPFTRQCIPFKSSLKYELKLFFSFQFLNRFFYLI
jgi:hypothetical protein